MKGGDAKENPQILFVSSISLCLREFGTSALAGLVFKNETITIKICFYSPGIKFISQASYRNFYGRDPLPLVLGMCL